MTTSILFVCTGNTFRSASAEYLLRSIVQKQHNTTFLIHSAGTKGNPYGMFPETIQRVARYGTDMSMHQYRVLNKDIIDKSDIIICMAKHHQQTVKEVFGRDSYLFNELAYNKQTDLKDDDEAAGEYDDLSQFVYETVDTIHEGMPTVYEKLLEMNL